MNKGELLHGFVDLGLVTECTVRMNIKEKWLKLKRGNNCTKPERQQRMLHSLENVKKAPFDKMLWLLVRGLQSRGTFRQVFKQAT